MNIYVYKEDKTLLRQFGINDDPDMEGYLTDMLFDPIALREFIAEEMFNSGKRKESSLVSFVLVSLQ